MNDAERSSEAPAYDLDRDLSKEGVMSSSIVGEAGCLSINPSEPRRSLRCKHSCRLSLYVISPGEDHRLSLDVIIPDVILY